MIITICGEKGGTGKSALSQSLVVFLKQQGKDVLLVDGDPQRTSAEWAQTRAERTELASVPCVEKTGSIASDLKDLATRYSHVVVDCGGFDSRTMRASLSVADAALLPFRAKRRDLRTTGKVCDVLENAKAVNPKIIIRSIITQAPTLPSQHPRIDNAKAFLLRHDIPPLMHVTRYLNAWDDAEESGASVLEYIEDEKAGHDAIDAFTEFFNSMPAVRGEKQEIQHG